MSGWAAVANTALDIGKNIYANKAARDAASTASWKNIHAYRNRYQWTTEDMRKAGLNPILAASGGFNVGSGPTIAPAQSFQANSQDISSAFANMASAKKSEAEAKESAERAKKAAADAKNALAQAAKASKEIKKIQQETRNLITMHEKLIKEISLIQSNTMLKGNLAKVASWIVNSWENILGAWSKFTGGPAPKAFYNLIDLGNQVMDNVEDGQKYKIKVK